MTVDAKKLASLVAVGAGAMTLTAAKAEASTIKYSGILNQTVGIIGPTRATFNQFVGSGGPSFVFSTSKHTVFTHHTYALKVLSNALGGFAMTANTASAVLKTFGAGAAWTAGLVAGGGTRKVADRAFGSTTNERGSAFNDKYFLYTFECGSSTCYGWLEASLQLVEADSTSASDGPNLTVESYAYDTTGAFLAAGQTTAPSGTPEPSSLGESGIAALVLGAEGLRRWRKRRTSAA